MPFGSLWLPVVLSAVAVFVVSSLIHMVLGYHKADKQRLPGETAIRDAVGKANPAPGSYFTPFCAGPKEMNDPAIKEQFEKGPVALVTVFPKGLPAMGKLLGLWFALSLLISFTVGYVARHTLVPGAEGIEVMRVTGAVAFAAYGFGTISNSIWMGEPWGNTGRFLIDAALYAVATGLCFMGLWPAA